MTEFDEISRAIGRIEGTIKSLKEDSRAQWQKLDRIEQHLTAQRIKTAGIAGAVSLLMSWLIAKLKTF